MRVLKGFLTPLVFLTIIFTTGLASAQSDKGKNARIFGLGQPQSIQSLPAGKLRNRLQFLPPQARARALRWLQDVSFPETDLDLLEIDDKGGVYYGDTLLPDIENTDQTGLEGPTIPEDVPAATLDDAFRLHSRPGSTNVVFIDFDGAILTDTVWNGNFPLIETRAYNVEGDADTFTTLERTRIVDIWHRVAEDLAPYDIDVTTEEPAVYTPTTGHILVTHNADTNGNYISCSSCGGVAYLNVFGRSNYHTYYSPALVFFNKLGNGAVTYVAEASSHEFGHNLGLSHDGADGTSYYRGHGSGLVSWAPIMGNSYYKNVTDWSMGEYAGATQTQDDLAIIEGQLGYRPDDHGDDRATATALLMEPDGSVVSSNPELDPHNLLTANKGVIGSASDIDVFSFVTGGGDINLTVNPGWDAFYRESTNRGSNLDVEVTLQRLNGTRVALSDPVTDTGAGINTAVNAGAYYLLITGVGNADTPYSDYDSLGQYFINGSIPPATPDNTAPTPNPMNFASRPVALSHHEITMIASTATDDINPVEYRFQCILGGKGCSNSGWQSGTSYTASGLAANTLYSFHVTARDQVGNQTESSVSYSATTRDLPPPPLAPSDLSATGISDSAIDLAWTDNANTETDYRIDRSPGGISSFVTIANLAANTTTYTDDTGLSESTSYDYRVTAVNGGVASGFDSASGKTLATPIYTIFGADSDTAMDGSVSGSFANTADDGGLVQSVTEIESGGKPTDRHSFLEHRWDFNINSGDSVSIYANAWSSGSGDGDSFNFEYAVNGGGFLPLFNVSSELDTNLQSLLLPGTPGGSIVIRVVDSDQTAGHREKNTVFIDHLYIQVANVAVNPPDSEPFLLTANGLKVRSKHQINLDWTGSTRVDVYRNGILLDPPGVINGSSYEDMTGVKGSATYTHRVCEADSTTNCSNTTTTVY